MGVGYSLVAWLVVNEKAFFFLFSRLGKRGATEDTTMDAPRVMVADQF